MIPLRKEHLLDARHKGRLKMQKDFENEVVVELSATEFEAVHGGFAKICHHDRSDSDCNNTGPV